MVSDPRVSQPVSRPQKLLPTFLVLQLQPPASVLHCPLVVSSGKVNGLFPCWALYGALSKGAAARQKGEDPASHF